MKDRACCILLLDDDPDYIDIFQDYLELGMPAADVTFKRATDIETAVALARSRHFDVIYVDYLLGRDTGTEALRQLRLDGVETAFVLLTGFETDAVEQQALAAGAIDYITKDDLNPTALARSVRYARDAYQRREALRHSLQQMQQAIDVKTEFLANMSHEMRTPLNGVMGYAQLLQLESLAANPVKVREYAKALEESGQRLLDLIEDLFRLKDAAPDLHRRAETISVAEFLEEVCDRHRAVAQARRIDFTLDAPHPMTSITTDAQTLQHAIRPIVDNAVKFTERDGRVSVEADVSDDGLIVRIADSGCGMDSKTAAAATQAFFIADSSFSRHHQGAGIGLAVAKNSIELLGGALSIDTTPGRGTVVTLHAPPLNAPTPFLSAGARVLAGD